MPTPLRQTSPAAERNKGPIVDALRQLLPPSGRLLEIAAGTGQHAVHGAAALPDWLWQPSDPAADALASISAWAASCPAPGMRPPLQLDVLDARWPAAVEPDGAQVPAWDAIFCANMLHIAPWVCCGALMRGAARLLAPDGQLLTYGPYRVAGEPTADSNEAFDADLRRRDPRWGLRWLHEVAAEAEAAGLQLVQRLAMPANNQLLVFRRGTTAPGR